MSDVILLSLTASLNPTLVAATTVMLLLDKPVRLMLGYLLGAMMTSITLGLVIIFAVPHSSSTSTTQNTLSPGVDMYFGADNAAAHEREEEFLTGTRALPVTGPVSREQTFPFGLWPRPKREGQQPSPADRKPKETKASAPPDAISSPISAPPAPPANRPASSPSP